MVQFKMYERQDSTLESQGTVKELIGKGGKIAFIPKNFKDESKRVVVVLTKKDGTSAAITCSKQVSEGLRNKTIELGHLIGFEILEGESGVPYISMPATGGGLVETAVDTIKVKDFVVSSELSLEDLIA